MALTDIYNTNDVTAKTSDPKRGTGYYVATPEAQVKMAEANGWNPPAPTDPLESARQKVAATPAPDLDKMIENNSPASFAKDYVPYKRPDAGLTPEEKQALQIDHFQKYIPEMTPEYALSNSDSYKDEQWTKSMKGSGYKTKADLVSAMDAVGLSLDTHDGNIIAGQGNALTIKPSEEVSDYMKFIQPGTPEYENFYDHQLLPFTFQAGAYKGTGEQPLINLDAINANTATPRGAENIEYWSTGEGSRAPDALDPAMAAVDEFAGLRSNAASAMQEEPPIVGTTASGVEFDPNDIKPVVEINGKQYDPSFLNDVQPASETHYIDIGLLESQGYTIDTSAGNIKDISELPDGAATYNGEYGVFTLNYTLPDGTVVDSSALGTTVAPDGTISWNLTPVYATSSGNIVGTEEEVVNAEYAYAELPQTRGYMSTDPQSIWRSMFGIGFGGENENGALIGWKAPDWWTGDNMDGNMLERFGTAVAEGGAWTTDLALGSSPYFVPGLRESIAFDGMSDALEGNDLATKAPKTQQHAAKINGDGRIDNFGEFSAFAGNALTPFADYATERFGGIKPGFVLAGKKIYDPKLGQWQDKTKWETIRYNPIAGEAIEEQAAALTETMSQGENFGKERAWDEESRSWVYTDASMLDRLGRAGGAQLFAGAAGGMLGGALGLPPYLMGRAQDKNAPSVGPINPVTNTLGIDESGELIPDRPEANSGIGPLTRESLAKMQEDYDKRNGAK